MVSAAKETYSIGGTKDGVLPMLITVLLGLASIGLIIPIMVMRLLLTGGKEVAPLIGYERTVLGLWMTTGIILLYKNLREQKKLIKLFVKRYPKDQFIQTLDMQNKLKISLLSPSTHATLAWRKWLLLWTIQNDEEIEAQRRKATLSYWLFFVTMFIGFALIPSLIGSGQQ